MDLRDVVLARRDRLLALIRMHAQQVADRRKVRPLPLLLLLLLLLRQLFPY